MELNKTLQQGITALKEGNFKEAERLYCEILRTNPTNPYANHNLGITLHALGKLNEAETSFKKAVTLKQDYLEAYNYLGITLQKLRKLNEAEVIFKKALTLRPDYVEIYNNLGITLQTLRKLNEAEQIFKKALTLKPDFTIVHNNLGNTLKYLGRLNEAEASFKKAVELKPDYLEAYNNLGITLKSLGKLNEAEEIFNKALAIKPDYKPALVNRGQILFDKREFELSLKDFDTCNIPYSRFRALISLYALGRVKEIYQRIKAHSELDNENLNIAAFSTFIANKEKKDTTHYFCKNPMDFINVSNLSSHIKDTNTFINEVIEELHNVKTFWEPYNKTTYKGFVSISNLFDNPSAKLNNLKSIIKNELDLYYLKFKNESCSYIKKWPTKKNLFAWHVILKNQGYQNAHIHPGGWLSGVIYLKVVPALEKNEGALEFGLNGTLYSDVNSPKVIYQPKIGDIIFFPSSLHHKTIPYSTDTDRISIAFDLLPEGVIYQQ